MPEAITDQRLEQWLVYPESKNDDAFVMDVMAGVRKAQRLRRLVLWLFGLIGAGFGVLGAFLLSDTITQLFLKVPAMGIMQAALFVTAAVSFYLWFMNDDLSLTV